MASQDQQLRIFFFPLMAPGHAIPMLDMARLFVERGVRATVLATPANSALLRRSIDQARNSGHPIDLLILPDQGQERLTSPLMSMKFFRALETLRRPLDQALRDRLPDCIIFDMYLPWTADVACGVGIPRLMFHTMGFFPLCVLDSLDRHVTAGRKLSVGDRGTVAVPGLPHRIEMKRSQLHGSVETRNEFTEFMERIVDSELQSDGALVNSFYEMEPEYANHYRNVMGRKAWHVGPVSLCNRDSSDMAERGASAASHHGSLMAWLDSKPPNSIVYVCFGSLSRLTKLQSHEIALGLEASGHPFVWVASSDGGCPEGFEERVGEQGQGLVVRGWAPQMLILHHRAVGGFVTHCGWNSVMESVSAGVPMITWPMFADQFYNEKLVVELLGIGVRVGAEVWGMREEEKPVVRSEEIRRAIARLMDGGEEAVGLVERAAGLKEKARKAVDVGGSSYTDMSRVVGDLMAGKRIARRER